MIKIHTKLMLCALVIFSLGAAGCSNQSAAGLDEDYMKSSEDLGKWVESVYTKTGGDYEKLSADEKKKYVDSFAGNEEAAKKYWDNYRTGSARPGVP